MFGSLFWFICAYLVFPSGGFPWDFWGFFLRLFSFGFRFFLWFLRYLRYLDGIVFFAFDFFRGFSLVFWGGSQMFVCFFLGFPQMFVWFFWFFFAYFCRFLLGNLVFFWGGSSFVFFPYRCFCVVFWCSFRCVYFFPNCFFVFLLLGYLMFFGVVFLLFFPYMCFGVLFFVVFFVVFVWLICLCVFVWFCFAAWCFLACWWLFGIWGGFLECSELLLDVFGLWVFWSPKGKSLHVVP